MNIIHNGKKLLKNFPIELIEFDNLEYTWNFNKKDLFTIMIYDADAPYPNKPSKSPYLHFLMINVPENDETKGDVIAELSNPNPPYNSEPHRYFIDIYLQADRYNAKNRNDKRNNFPVERFKNNHDLTLVHRAVIIYDIISEEMYLADVYNTNNNDINLSHELIVPETDLTEGEQSFCSCAIKVGQRSSNINPWAVCRSKTKEYSNECFENYNYDLMTDSELKSMAKLHKISIPRPYNRSRMLERLDDKKMEKDENKMLTEIAKKYNISLTRPFDKDKIFERLEKKLSDNDLISITKEYHIRVPKNFNRSKYLDSIYDKI